MKKLVVEEGENLELWCTSNSPWDSCEITQIPFSKDFCTSKSSIEYNRIRVSSCNDLEGRFESIGDSGNFPMKCGIKIKNLQREEDGTWRCDLHSSELEMTISQSFDIFILPKADPTFPFKWNKEEYNICLKVGERSLCPPEAVQNGQVRRWWVCDSLDNTTAPKMQEFERLRWVGYLLLQPQEGAVCVKSATSYRT